MYCTRQIKAERGLRSFLNTKHRVVGAEIEKKKKYFGLPEILVTWVASLRIKSKIPVLDLNYEFSIPN